MNIITKTVAIQIVPNFSQKDKVLHLKIFIVKRGPSKDFSKPMLMLSCLAQFGHVKFCITLGTYSITRIPNHGTSPP